MDYYFKHLRANAEVGIRSLILALFHFAHGLVPCKWTSHESYRFNLYGRKNDD